MSRLIPAFLWLVIATASVGCSGALSRVDVGRVLTSGRDGWQHPDRVVASLEIAEGDRVAEIGAGSGYWLPWLSEAVGPTGRVYAVEVEPERVERLRAAVEAASLANVEVILGDYDDPRLPDGRIDLAMTCLTYHHIEDRVSYFRSLQASLAEGGRVAHLDDMPGSPPPFSWLQADGHWTDPEALVAEMAEAGFVVEARFDFLPIQSFHVFRPDSEAVAAASAEVR